MKKNVCHIGALELATMFIIRSFTVRIAIFKGWGAGSIVNMSVG